ELARRRIVLPELAIALGERRLVARRRASVHPLRGVEELPRARDLRLRQNVGDRKEHRAYPPITSEPRGRREPTGPSPGPWARGDVPGVELVVIGRVPEVVEVELEIERRRDGPAHHRVEGPVAGRLLEEAGDRVVRRRRARGPAADVVDAGAQVDLPGQREDV